MYKKSVRNCAAISTVLMMAGVVYHCKNPKIESDYYSPKVLATHFNGEKYVGSETCAECHSDIYKTHLETAHYKTSAVVDSVNLMGSFETGSNVLDLESVKFKMVSEGEFFYQLTHLKNRTTEIPEKKFDIVIGSGTRGQTYGTWIGDSLFQLQPSYYTQNDSWVNSPGYPQYYIERPIRDACLKCHVTFALNRNLPALGNEFDKENLILGIDCERCHRPAEKHVTYHRQNPKADIGEFILPLDSLSRQQRLDVCAQCHSGPRNRILKGNSFSFLAGDDLETYSENMGNQNPNIMPDVHGNQYGLLTRSKCFKNAVKMDCTTCHNPHKNQRGNTSYYNQKCMECHDVKSIGCSASPSERTTKTNNCIACHMPSTASRNMTVKLTAADSLETSFYIRSHLIGIYQSN